jgi:hypothetical protein
MPAPKTYSDQLRARAVHWCSSRALGSLIWRPTWGSSARRRQQRAAGRRSMRVIEEERLTERIREPHAANYLAYSIGRGYHATGGRRSFRR